MKRVRKGSQMKNRSKQYVSTIPGDVGEYAGDVGLYAGDVGE